MDLVDYGYLSYRWTGWVWKIIVWSSWLQENYWSFKMNILQINKEKMKDCHVTGWTCEHYDFDQLCLNNLWAWLWIRYSSVAEFRSWWVSFWLSKWIFLWILIVLIYLITQSIPFKTVFPVYILPMKYSCPVRKSDRERPLSYIYSA